MKALVQDMYGTSEVLRLDDVEQPEPAAGEVLVRIAAASVNAADWHVMRGEPKIARLMDRRIFGRTGPRERIRGRDFAGTIDAVGPDVTGWRVGDTVLGEDEATLAEYAAVPQGCLARKPEALSFEEAAALPLAAVTAVCSTRNVDLVTSLGATEVVDYTREDFTSTARSYDVVLDLVGTRSLRDLRRVLAPGGRLVLSGGGNPGHGRYLGPIGLMARGGLFGRLVGVRVHIPRATPNAERLTDLADMAARGDIRPVLDRTYPLADAAAAMRHLEVDHARGKIVVTT